MGLDNWSFFWCFSGFDYYAPPTPKPQALFPRPLYSCSHCPFLTVSNLHICPLLSFIHRFYTCTLILATTVAPFTITLLATWPSQDKSNHVCFAEWALFKDALMIFYFWFCIWCDSWYRDRWIWLLLEIPSISSRIPWVWVNFVLTLLFPKRHSWWNLGVDRIYEEWTFIVRFMLDTVLHLNSTTAHKLNQFRVTIIHK